MFKKALLLFMFFGLMACHSTQNVVRTTPKSYPKPKKGVVHATKKPEVSKPVASNSDEKKTK